MDLCGWSIKVRFKAPHSTISTTCTQHLHLRTTDQKCSGSAEATYNCIQTPYAEALPTAALKRPTTALEQPTTALQMPTTALQIPKKPLPSTETAYHSTGTAYVSTGY